jgi:ATP-dependent DNA helicase RecG
MEAALPANKSGLTERLVVDRILVRHAPDRFDITNLGALLFAKDLSRFEGISRKSVRVVVYRGVNRLETIRERVMQKGYAAGFEELIAFIVDQTPQNEVIGLALRREIRMYPEKAIRELVPNSMIHQGRSLEGAPGATAEVAGPVWRRMAVPPSSASASLVRTHLTQRLRRIKNCRSRDESR